MKKYSNIRIYDPNEEKIRTSNRMERNQNISNKKCLFYNIRQFFEY